MKVGDIYVVNTDAPTWDGGDRRNDGSCDFRKGDRVRLVMAEADETGDVRVTNLTREFRRHEDTPNKNEDRWIAASCLSPALAVVPPVGAIDVKVTPDLTDFAALLVEQIASGLEEAAKRIRAAGAL